MHGTRPVAAPGPGAEPLLGGRAGQSATSENSADRKALGGGESLPVRGLRPREEAARQSRIAGDGRGDACRRAADPGPGEMGRLRGARVRSETLLLILACWLFRAALARTDATETDS